MTSPQSIPGSTPDDAPASPPLPAVTQRLDASTLTTDAERDTNTLVGLADDIVLQDAPICTGDKLGKYEIRSQLGAGGMGAVYLAFDPLIEREVALKVLSPDLGNSPTALQRFLGEARAIGRLNHPHVVSIYDIDQWNGRYYLVMELLSGGSVAGHLDKLARMPWQDATRIVAEAARGLAAAHAAGLIHRDIKPDNLMLTADGSVKVVDFGLSKLQDAANDSHTAVTKAGQILGTPQYMSPEQFETSDVDARTDIYSLGATYFHLLTSRFPFHDCRTIMQVMSAHMTKPPPVPRDFQPDVPEACNRIVARAMTKETADRYQSAAELAAELEALLQGTTKSPSPISAPPEITDRPLGSVLIVEPSKLQGAMLKGVFTRVAGSVQVLSSGAERRQAVADAPPDLFITALELPDGRGTELLQDLCRQSQLNQTTTVLNSSDSTIEDLIAVGPAACLVLAPKKAKPEEILRLAHATGPSVMNSGPLSAPIDPAALRVLIETESGRIPDALAELLRELKLLDVDVTTHLEAGAAADLVLILRAVPLSSAGFAALALHASESGPLAAAIQVEPERLTLRAAGRNGVVAACARTLDARRLHGLLQGCRL